MDKPTPEEALKLGRANTYAGVDGDLYSDIGFFATWYGLAELQITRLLAQYTGSHDLEAFDILCRGMDARVKIERLRLAIKRRAKIGTELHLRLAFFSDNIIGLRNSLMHSAFSTSEDDGPKRYFLSGLAAMPWEELGMGKPMTKLKPKVVGSLDLYEYGLWMSYLAKDLSHVVSAEDQQGKPIIEIVGPKSMVPEAFRQKHARKADRAKVDRPDQTRPQ